MSCSYCLRPFVRQTFASATLSLSGGKCRPAIVSSIGSLRTAVRLTPSKLDKALGKIFYGWFQVGDAALCPAVRSHREISARGRGSQLRDGVRRLVQARHLRTWARRWPRVLRHGWKSMTFSAAHEPSCSITSEEPRFFLYGGEEASYISDILTLAA